MKFFSPTLKSLLLLVTLVVAVPASIFAGPANSAKKETKAPATFKMDVIDANGSGGKNIVQVAQGSKDHSTLVAAVVAADLVPTLTGAGPYTIFAPTNAAFAKLPAGTVEGLLKPENKDALNAILLHHAAAPAYRPNILAEMSTVDMQDGPKLKITQKDGALFVDDAKITAAIKCQNGIIYVVDGVLLAK